MNGNIIEIFHRNADALGAKRAIIEGEGEISYKVLRDDVVRVAAYLHERGVRRGDSVLIFVPMSARLYTLLLAIFHLGAIAVFVDAWASRDRLAHACRMLPIRAFIGTPKAHLLRFLSREVRAIPIKLISRLHAWKPKGPAPKPAPVSPGDAALITFTTGSTGAPKAARRSHRFLTAQHDALVAALAPDADDVDMPILPIFVLGNLALGCTTVLPPVDPRHVEKFEPEKVVEAIVRNRVITTSGSPAFYEKLAGYILERRIELPLERIFLGGAPVFPRLARLLVAAFPKADVTIVYGSTEAEPISMLPARDLLEHAAAANGRGLLVGRPVDEIDVRIIRIIDGPITMPEGIEKIELGPGEVGEICVAGEHVLKEYYGDVDVVKENKIDTIQALWHRTGDGGYRDSDGNLYLMGRVKQSFLHNGERLFVFPIEERFQEIEGVTIGTIMKIGDRLKGIVERERLREGERGRVGEWERRLREAGIPFDDLVLIDAMPRDPRHHSKIDYTKLREMMDGQ